MRLLGIAVLSLAAVAGLLGTALSAWMLWRYEEVTLAWRRGDMDVAQLPDGRRQSARELGLKIWEVPRG